MGLEGQILAFKALKAFTAKPDNLLCQLLTHAEPILDLGHPGAQLPDSDRQTPFIIFDDVDTYAPPEMPVFEEIPAAVVTDAAIAAQVEAMGEVSQSVPGLSEQSVPELSEEVNVQLRQPAVGYSDEVFVDDLADEFET